MANKEEFLEWASNNILCWDVKWTDLRVDSTNPSPKFTYGDGWIHQSADKEDLGKLKWTYNYLPHNGWLRVENERFYTDTPLCITRGEWVEKVIQNRFGQENSDFLEWAVENVSCWSDMWTHLRVDDRPNPPIFTRGYEWKLRPVSSEWPPLLKWTNELDGQWLTLGGERFHTEQPQVVTREQWLKAKHTDLLSWACKEIHQWDEKWTHLRINAGSNHSPFFTKGNVELVNNWWTFSTIEDIATLHLTQHKLTSAVPQVITREEWVEARGAKGSCCGNDMVTMEISKQNLVLTHAVLSRYEGPFVVSKVFKDKCKEVFGDIELPRLRGSQTFDMMYDLYDFLKELDEFFNDLPDNRKLKLMGELDELAERKEAIEKELRELDQ